MRFIESKSRVSDRFLGLALAQMIALAELKNNHKIILTLKPLLHKEF
jgi:hypothetical protein